MKKSDAAKRQGLKSMSKRRSGEKSSKRLGKISPRDSKNEAVATTIKIVIATAPSFYIKIRRMHGLVGDVADKFIEE